MGVQGALCPIMPQSVKRAQDGRYSLLTQYKITKRASAVALATTAGNSSTLSSTRPPKVIKTTASQRYPDPNTNRIQFVDLSGPLASSIAPASSCLDRALFISNKMGRTRWKATGGIADFIGERWAAPKAATEPATVEVSNLRLTCGAACRERSTTPQPFQAQDHRARS